MPDLRGAAMQKIIKVAVPTLKMLGSSAAPAIFKGFMLEYLKHISYPDLCIFIRDKVSLWQQMTPDEIEKIHYIIHELGDCPWLNSQWLIEAAKSSKDLRLITSLFLGSAVARQWLDSQLLEIRGKLTPA